jgi:hypothetical protein
MGSLSTFDVADVKVLSFTVTDLRFPTSLDGVGSDAMHVGTNGSHPYIRLETNHPDLAGEGIVSRNQISWHLLKSNQMSHCRLSATGVAASSFAWPWRFLRNE